MAPARDRRTGFSRRRQYGAFLAYVLAVAGAVVGAVLLVASTFNPPAFAALRMTLGSVTAPISGTFVAIGDAVSGVPDTIGHYFFVHSENDRLRAELEQSRKILLTARTIAHDNRRLRRLLAVPQHTMGTGSRGKLDHPTGLKRHRLSARTAQCVPFPSQLKGTFREIEAWLGSEPVFHGTQGLENHRPRVLLRGGIVPIHCSSA